MSLEINGRSLNLEYPCRWNYKVIGENEESVKAVIENVLKNTDFEMEHSRDSREGKYCSILVIVTVESDEHRNQIYTQFKQNPAIKFVL